MYPVGGVTKHPSDSLSLGGCTLRHNWKKKLNCFYYHVCVATLVLLFHDMGF